METANFGDVVKVHYVGTLTTGETFDSSYDSNPLEFTIGSGAMIEGFDQGIIGMAVGETKVLNIPMDKAYGFHNEEYVFPVDRNNLPSDLIPEKGMQLSMSNPGDPNAHPITVIVKDFDENTITLDANPPLAGEDLIFNVEVMAILKPL